MNTSGSDSWKLSRGGLWSYDISVKQMKQLLTERPKLNFGQFRGIDHDALYAATTLWVTKFDLKQDLGSYVSFKSGTLFESEIREMPLNKKTPRTSDWTEPNCEEAGTRCVIDNWLWVGEPFSRVSKNGRSIELLDPKLLPGAQPIGPVSAIEQFDDVRVLLGDHRQLWVMKR